MARLIDADALEAKLEEQRKLYIEMDMKGAEHLLVHDVLHHVWEAPTIDAVPVVRCKECRWYVRSMIKQDGTLDERYKPDWCDLYRKVREETYFCADGERKDDE